jgi:hypothetical protein
MRVLLAIAFLIVLGCTSKGENSASSAGADSPATMATLPKTLGWPSAIIDVDGNVFQPNEQPKLEAVVMVFVLQDCPIANSYHPKLNELAEKFANRGVRMFVVETDPQIDAAAARKHRDEFAMKPVVVIDADHHWVKHAGATKTPEAAVFLPNGQLVYRGRIDDRYAGFGKKRTEATVHDLQDTLEAVLAGQPVPNQIVDAIGCYIPEAPAAAGQK